MSRQFRNCRKCNFWQNRQFVLPGLEIVSLHLSCAGWPQEKISEAAGIRQQRISQITNITNFCIIGNLLLQSDSHSFYQKRDGKQPIRLNDPCPLKKIIIDTCLYVTYSVFAVDIMMLRGYHTFINSMSRQGLFALLTVCCIINSIAL